MTEDLAQTTSLCPDCLDPVPGRYKVVDGRIELERTCPEHGTASPVVWHDAEHWRWAGEHAPEPIDQGDLQVLNDHACLAVVEVTQRCNLECSYCFAASGPHGEHRSTDEILDLLDVVARDGSPRPIQFSGGEPTIRDDLPDLVEAAHERGFDHIEVNTNGIRLARDLTYAPALKEAGVTAIYLQFDGFEPETYQATRDRADLPGIKADAIDACREAGLPVILVCTVVPGVNEHELGDIVTYALANQEVIRSVNLQPVAHVGRYAKNDGRFSLDEVARVLSEQLGWLEPRDLRPVPCCSAYCQSATALLPDGDGGAVPLTRYVDDALWDQLAGLVDERDWMELLAGTPDAQDRSAFVAACCGIEVPGGAETLIEEILPVGITGFMDADAADVDRLGQCCIAVPTHEDGMVPFCAYNMTTRDGRYKFREERSWAGRRDTEPPTREGDTPAKPPEASPG